MRALLKQSRTYYVNGNGDDKVIYWSVLLVSVAVIAYLAAGTIALARSPYWPVAAGIYGSIGAGIGFHFWLVKGG